MSYCHRIDRQLSDDLHIEALGKKVGDVQVTQAHLTDISDICNSEQTLLVGLEEQTPCCIPLRNRSTKLQVHLRLTQVKVRLDQFKARFINDCISLHLQNHTNKKQKGNEMLCETSKIV
jgi:hypothetical protein